MTARAIAEPWDQDMEHNLRNWIAGGYVHLIGSDGHGLDRRRPELAAGFSTA